MTRITTVTIEAIEAKQTELAGMIAKYIKYKSQTDRPIVLTFPELSIELQLGERYAGPVFDASGNLIHHLVLMAPRYDGKLKWQSARDWAEINGGSLPNRQEQALLYANCKTHLKPEWHWSCETTEGDSNFAWYCQFQNGGQYCFHKTDMGRVVAVRRVIKE
jgi:hypothetical protein